MSRRPGASASDAELTNIDKHSLWLYVRGEEYFFPYGESPSFREAKVCDILGVTLLHEEHLHWPALDVDLSVASRKRPGAFPLKYE